MRRERPADVIVAVRRFSDALEEPEQCQFSGAIALAEGRRVSAATLLEAARFGDLLQTDCFT